MGATGSESERLPAAVEFADYIEEAVEETDVARTAEGLDAEINATLETLRPLLEAVREHSLARGFHSAVFQAWRRGNLDSRPYMKQIENEAQSRRDSTAKKVEALRGEYEETLVRLRTLRRIRELAPEPEQS